MKTKNATSTAPLGPRPENEHQQGDGRQRPELVAAHDVRHLPQLGPERQRLLDAEHRRRVVAERSHQALEDRDVCQDLQVRRVPREEDQRRDDHDRGDHGALGQSLRPPE
jgi:hypothetical protein